MGENILKLIKPADIITLLNALLGFASVIMTARGRVEEALVLILLAVIADGVDGAFARYSGTGVLGANLDSLADAISFGVAPAAAAFFSLASPGSLAWAFSGFFLVCGILRLARFNVSGKKDGFEGIPITSGGFIVALFLLSGDRVPYAGYVFPLLLLLLSLLMVSTIGYPKMKNPLLLALPGILLLADIALFYLGFADAVKLVSSLLFALTFVYILSPAGRWFYDRSKRAG